MEYKDDMDGPKFEEFLNETCSILKEKYEKIALVMDNASYHTKLVRISNINILIFFVNKLDFGSV